MAFCKNCGAELDESVKVCPTCGTPVEAAPAAETAAPEEGNFFKKLWNKIYNGPDHTAEYDPAEAEANKVWGILCYLSWLVLIPLIFKRDVKVLRFHINQGLMLFFCELALGIITYIPVIGWILSILNLVATLFAVIGIIHVCQGKAKELFFIGKYRILK